MTALTHTYHLTGRRLKAVGRQPAFIAISLIQPVIWLFLFGQLFRKVVEIPASDRHLRTFTDTVRVAREANTGLISRCWLT